MSYAVSAFHERSDHMSPVAALLAGLLHAATALAVFWVSPLNQRDIEVPTVDVTIEEPKPPEQPAQEAAKPPIPPPPPPAVQAAPPPPPPAAAAAAKPEPKPAQTPESKPQEQITSKVQPGVEPPAPVKPDPPKQETTKPAEATLEPPKPAEPKPQEPKPQPAQEAAATPPPPSAPPQPEPPLEKVVPPVETPPAPLTMRDFVKVMPPPPVPPPRPQPAPPQPHPPQPLQHSPLSTVPTPQPQTSSSASVSTFVNPAAEAANTSAKNAYLVAVLRKFSQYLPNLRAKNEGGTVVLRFVIARDGRLIDATILKSSGVMALDKGMLDTLRAAAPYPPLPPEITENQVVFVQPIQARQ